MSVTIWPTNAVLTEKESPALAAAAHTHDSYGTLQPRNAKKQAEATDRASQREAKYREVLEEAERATKEHGADSPQARAAWDAVDEIEVIQFCPTAEAK